jgi:dTDP-4-dehydrorhamnose 3,5-epimerase
MTGRNCLPQRLHFSRAIRKTGSTTGQKRLWSILAAIVKRRALVLKITPTAIPEVLIIEPKVFGDERGFFFESFNQAKFEAAIGRKVNFVQDNHSKSAKNVLRGLHYQIQQPQGKLVRVVQGEVFDVAVDVRKSSPTFGNWVGEILSADNKKQLWVPEGFAHGFLVLTESAEFLYKTTDYYAPEYERSILWKDPAIAVKWPVSGDPILSIKDQQAKTLALAEHFA